MSNSSIQHGIRASDSGAFKVFRFEGKDFHLWKFVMERYLKKKRLYRMVDGSVPRPPSSSEAEEKWEDDNNSAETEILTTVGISQLQHLTTCTSAHEMWTKLYSMNMEKVWITLCCF